MPKRFVFLLLCCCLSLTAWAATPHPVNLNENLVTNDGGLQLLSAVYAPERGCLHRGRDHNPRTAKPQPERRPFGAGGTWCPAAQPAGGELIRAPLRRHLFLQAPSPSIADPIYLGNYLDAHGAERRHDIITR